MVTFDINKEENKQESLLRYLTNNSLNVLVKPNSSKNEIVGYDDSRGALKINIKAVPEKGKANIELVKFLRKLLRKNGKIKDIKIVSGHTSHQKVIKIEEV